MNPSAPAAQQIIQPERGPVVLFVVTLMCLNVLVHAQDDTDVRKELEAQYKKVAEAHG